MVAIATSLGLLAHGGAIFTLPPLLLFLVIPNISPGARQILSSSAISILLMIPWVVYQKFYNPPGNRLLKWHLAGIKSVENLDGRSSVQTILGSYKTLSTAKIFKNKWENTKVLIGIPPIKSNWRPQEFFHAFRALNVLNVGWLVLLLSVFLKRWRRLIEPKAEITMVSASAIGLAFWVVVMFGPGETLIHHGSYATMMILFSSLAIMVIKLPKSLRYFLLIVQMTIFAITWIFWDMLIEGVGFLICVPNIPMLVVFICISAALFRIFNRLSQSF